MTLRQYLMTMSLATLLCYTAWFFVVLNLDPFEISILGLVFFYISLFLSLLGTASLIFFFLYRYVGRGDQPLFRYVQKSWRHAFVVALYIIILLALLGARYLSVLTGGLVTGIFILLISFDISLNFRKLSPERSALDSL